MRKPPRSGMPIPLTLPLHFDLRLRTRRRRLLRVGVATLALLGAALLAAGFWVPAKAELGTSALAIGDTFTLARPDGVVRTYEVIALDVVDSERVELVPDGDERLASLVTPWPSEAAAVGGQWRYVVTGRLRF